MPLRILPNLAGPSSILADDRLSALQVRDGDRMRAYREYLQLYEGKHWPRPRTGRSAITVNYCHAVVDKGISYLLGRGLNWAVEPRRTMDDGRQTMDDGPQSSIVHGPWSVERYLYDAYEDEGLAAVDLMVAHNAALLGDGVYKVTWDPLGRRPRVQSVDPLSFYPDWSADELGAFWRVRVGYGLEAAEAKRLYGVERGRGPVGVVETWTASAFTLEVGGGVLLSGPNPYGFIPFVHVPNLPAANEVWGISDLRDLTNLNRTYNERLSDQSDTIRYHADPPVVFKGVANHVDLPVGPGTTWDIPPDADVTLLEWRGAAPAVEDHLRRLQTAIFEVAETPRTAFGDSGRLLSGVALETELRPLILKTLRKRTFWTDALRRRNRMLLRLAEANGALPPGAADAYRVKAIWPPMLPKDDAVEVQNNVSLVAAGLRSARSAMDALGTEDPEGELRKVLEDRAALDAPSTPSPSGRDRPTPSPSGRGLG